MRPTGSNIRVLVIDRNTEDRQFLQLALSQSRKNEFELDFIDCVEESESQLRDGQVDLLMIGADVAGEEILDQLTRARAIDPDLAVIVLAHRFDSATASQCVARGAQDCLPKNDSSPASLRRTIHRAVQRQRVVNQLLVRHQSLAAELARHDERRSRNHHFLRAVSHDFRTPLTVITEYASLLNEGLVGEVELDPKQKQFLQIISDRSDDLNTMVDNLLDATKIEAHCLSLWRKRCKLQQVITAIEPNLRSKAAVKDVDLELQVPQDMPAIFADDEKVQRILQNVLSCSIQTSGGAGRVRLSAHVDRSANDLVVTITDTHRDVDEQEESEMLQNLSTQGPSHDCKGQSLSLSVARELARLNLGDFTRRVIPQEGIESTLTLPLADPAEVARRFQKQLGDSVTVALFDVFVEAGQTGSGSEIDALLNLILEPNDLLMPCADDRWTLMIPVEDNDDAEQQIAGYRQRAGQWLEETNQRRGGKPLPSIRFARTQQPAATLTPPSGLVACGNQPQAT